MKSDDNDVFQDCQVTLSNGSPFTLRYPATVVSRGLRKSASDPTLDNSVRKESAVDGLNRCLSLVSILGSRVDKLSSSFTKMPGACKQCHGETGSSHTGSRWGFDHCTLPHSDDCPGGMEEIPGKRKGCPQQYTLRPRVASGNETEVSNQRYSDLDSDSESESDAEDKKKELATGGGPQTLKMNQENGPSVVTTSIMSSVTHTPSLLGSSVTSLGINSTPLMSTGFSSQNHALGGAASLLLGGLSSSLLGGVSSHAPGQQASQSWLLQKFLEQQQAMQLQQQHQQQAMILENQRVVSEMRVAVEEAKEAARSAASVRRKSNVSFSETLLPEAEALKSINSKDKVNKTKHIGKDMNDVRKTDGLREAVEKIMQEQVYTHASLAKTPNAVTSDGVSFPGLHTPGSDNSQTAAVIAALQAELAEKQRSLDAVLGSSQAKKSKSERRAARAAASEQAAAAAKAERRLAAEKLSAARSEIKLAKRAARTLGLTGVSSSSGSSSDSVVATDLDSTLTKKKLKKKVPVPNLDDTSDSDDDLPRVLTDDRGRAYKVINGKLKSLPTFVKDPMSGQFIKTTPTAINPNVQEQSSSDSSEEKTAKKREKKMRQKARKADAAENVVGITPLCAAVRSQPLPPVPSLHENRGKGEDKKHVLSVVDWAKMCPIKYAATCTSKNLNLPVFIWARLAELRAMSAGATDMTLKPGELDARLRHLQCILELVGTNSVLSEYSGYGWQLGRDYDGKVQATMDSGASDWVSFNSMFSLGPHPSFVLSAKDEVERVTKKVQLRQEEDPIKTKKKICGRFNSCRTSKRCEWEVENPHTGRCKRLHQCSYCKLTNNRSVFHQAWDCPSGGKEAVLAGTHSL